MYHVVIVEDEPKIAHLISQLIDWEKLGLKIVAHCSTGPAALEYITTHKPEIVLTDIKLPGLDGLALIAKIRELELATSIVIISGYRQFDYAKKALQHGVEEYLIKPVNKDELLEVLTRICEKLERQETSREQDSKHSRALRDLLFSRLISGELDLKKISRANEYGVHMSSGQVQCIALALDESAAILTEEYMNELIVVARKILAPLCYTHIPYIHNNHSLYILCNYPSSCAITTVYTTLFQAVQRYIAQCDTYKPIVTMAVGTPQESKDLQYSLIASTNIALQYRLQTRCNWIIYYDQLKLPDQPTPLMSRDELADLKHFAELLDFSHFHIMVQSIFGTITPQTSPIEVGRMIEAIIAMVRETVCLVIPETDPIAMESSAMESFYRQYTLVGLEQSMLAWCKQEFSHAIEVKKARGSKPIYDAKQYIAANFASPLTLEELAQVVSLNPSYFSTLFKKETDYNFSDYLAELRMNEAKKLLRDSTKSIAVIGAEVGYPDNRYFSRVFTKTMGIKPSAYRSLHR